MSQLNKEGLQRLVENIKKYVDTKIEPSKGDILAIQNEFSKIENSKCQTINGVKEFECKDGYVDNVIIKGETWVNLLDKPTICAITESNGNIWTNTEGMAISESNGIISFTTSSINQWDDCGQAVAVKPDTTYTFSVNIVDSMNSKTNVMVVFYSDSPTINKNLANQDIFIGIKKHGLSSDNGKRVFKLRTPSNCTYMACIVSCELTNTTYKFSEFSLVEGNIELPYFKGLQSVGQGDKIEVLTRCEDGNIFDGEMVSGTLNDTTGLPQIQVESLISRNYTRVTPNSSINIYNDKNYARTIFYYDKAFNYLGKLGTAEATNIPNDCHYIKFRTNKGQNDISVKYWISYNEMLNYKPPRQDKKHILTTLRSLPDGVKDTVEKRENKYYKIEKLDETIFDASRNWVLHKVSDSFVSIKLVGAFTHSTGSVCNLFAYNSHGIDATGEGYTIDGAGILYVSISKSKLSTPNATGFKAWLRDNDLIIVHALKEPKLIPLPNFNPQTFGDKTKLLINSGAIQSECEFEVTNSLRSEIDAVENKVTNVEEGLLDNIYGFQRWRTTNDKGFAKERIDKKDLNNVLETGLYYGLNIINAPDDAYYQVRVTRSALNFVVQEATRIGSREHYIRIIDTGVAKSWQKLTTSEVVIALEQQISELEIQLMERGV